MAGKVMPQDRCQQSKSPLMGMEGAAETSEQPLVRRQAHGRPGEDEGDPRSVQVKAIWRASVAHASNDQGNLHRPGRRACTDGEPHPIQGLPHAHGMHPRAQTLASMGVRQGGSAAASILTRCLMALSSSLRRSASSCAQPLPAILSMPPRANSSALVVASVGLGAAVSGCCWNSACLGSAAWGAAAALGLTTPPGVGNPLEGPAAEFVMSPSARLGLRSATFFLSALIAPSCFAVALMLVMFPNAFREEACPRSWCMVCGFSVMLDAALELTGKQLRAFSLSTALPSSSIRGPGFSFCHPVVWIIVAIY